MSNLVDELKKEHSLLVETLNKVQKLGITSQEGQKTLFQAKQGLLAHLKKEDEQLYPILNLAADNDINLKSTLDIFAKNMEDISKTALGFFEKYATGGSGIEFAKDFGILFSALSQRIRKEENIIYKTFNELKN